MVGFGLVGLAWGWVGVSSGWSDSVGVDRRWSFFVRVSGIWSSRVGFSWFLVGVGLDWLVLGWFGLLVEVWSG